MKNMIAPSILNADFANLKREVEAVENAGVDYLHLDVMDGEFAPSISFGDQVISALRSHSHLFFDVHLMIQHPERYISTFIAAGADSITVHVEGNAHLHRLIYQVKSANKQVAVALNPATPLEVIKHIIRDVDMVLLMSVNPGFGGQRFIPEVIPKIQELRDMIEKSHVEVNIEVDGGITPETAKQCLDAGANIFVVGSYIYKHRNDADKKHAIKTIRRAINHP
ncbi:ribulose-phosphate 3-epimerase [Pullulanibacillus camelliae]|uniref:Ribulose-phosphate 3-epimerase n=1 Tax=Pullulanibacillus camelliae TaxID=1707096 RepID=A0A8J2VM66_9BACL|nr:ribulose-phosphate 3-epimerase [Pullulanibacillus camelliae]GGE31555.1 ribulose-phosphate 3-epimerase [Pullulanibacillus camelliae]